MPVRGVAVKGIQSLPDQFLGTSCGRMKLCWAMKHSIRGSLVCYYFKHRCIKSTFLKGCSSFRQLDKRCWQTGKAIFFWWHLAQTIKQTTGAVRNPQVPFRHHLKQPTFLQLVTESINIHHRGSRGGNPLTGSWRTALSCLPLDSPTLAAGWPDPCVSKHSTTSAKLASLVRLWMSLWMAKQDL